MSRDGKKTGGRNFVKGMVTNPHGAPRVPQEVKEARKLTQAAFDQACGKLLFMSQEKLKELVENKDTNVLEALVGRILYKGIKDSSQYELNYFIERFLGKVADNHNFTGNLNTGLVQLLEELKKQKELENGEEISKEVKEIEDV